MLAGSGTAGCDTATSSTSPVPPLCTPTASAENPLIMHVSAAGPGVQLPPTIVPPSWVKPATDGPVKKLKFSPLCTDPMITSVIGALY